jgi:hypothetical protein
LPIPGHDRSEHSLRMAWIGCHDPAERVLTIREMPPLIVFAFRLTAVRGNTSSDPWTTGFGEGSPPEGGCV